MNEQIVYLNNLWNEYIRNFVEPEKIMLLMNTNEKIMDFLSNCQVSHSESNNAAESRTPYCIVHLKRDEDMISFLKQEYDNYPSNVNINFEVAASEEEKIEIFLVEWFKEMKLHLYHEHRKVMEAHGDYFMTFLNYAKCDISTVRYVGIDKKVFTISTDSETYSVIHKDDIVALAKSKMIVNVLYGEIFSKRAIRLRDLKNVSGIPVAKIKEMYQLEKGQTLDQDQADEFIDKYADTDAYYEKHFDEYGYAGLLGSRKYPEVISGDFYILRIR